MASKGCKTRGACGGSNLKSLIGPGKEFLPSEVPTLRAVLQDENTHNDVSRNLFPIRQIAAILAPQVISQWQKSNIKFQPPVLLQIKTIVDKITKEWTDYARAKTLTEDKKTYLDSLFDILSCKHTIQLCDAAGCDGCSIGAHVSCDCHKDKKIPKIDLCWVYHQRNKKKLRDPVYKWLLRILKKQKDN